MNHIELKSLLEKTRRDLLLKQRREAPKRVKRSKAYSVSNITIDANAFVNDWLVITTNISGNSSTYEDQIAFKNVLTDLIAEAKVNGSHYVNSKLIQKSLKQSLDKNDLYINCTCPDFKYRYAYHSTKDKFKWGKLQNSNGKGIANPNNDIGSMCKHLYALLYSNKFINHISDKIMRTIMGNLDIIVKKYDIDLNEFIVNTAAYDKLLKMNVTRSKGGQFQKVDNNEQNNQKDTQENQDDNQSEENNNG